MLSLVNYKIRNTLVNTYHISFGAPINNKKDITDPKFHYNTNFNNIPLNYFAKVSFREQIKNNFNFDFEVEDVVKQEAAKLYQILCEHFEKQEKLVSNNNREQLKLTHKQFLNAVYCALKYAYKKHKGQYREGGDPYIVHPIGVAKIICDNGNFNLSTVKAALLHDVVEDTSTSLQEINGMFGKVTGKIVDGVTKIEQAFNSKQEENDHNLAKIMLAVADEPRVAFVKLADRIYNMRTMGPMNPKKQQAKAEETLKIYVPLAERLGMKSTRVELENLSLKYMDPDGYNHTVRIFDIFKEQAKQVDGLIKRLVIPELKSMGITSEISLQPKSYYRVYKKNQDGSEIELADLYSIKLIVPNINSCYTALRVLSEKFTLLDGSIKYYIQNPKENLYKSLHARIVSDDTQIQVQIRTPEMQRYIEHGFSAFLQDKDSYSKDEFKLSWIKNIGNYKEMITDELDKIANYIEKDIFSHQIHIVTDGHSVIDMPIGSTVTDFAFRTNHNDPWNIAQAKVNGSTVPLNWVLKKGDIVSIKYGQNSTDLNLLSESVNTQFAKELIGQEKNLI